MQQAINFIQQEQAQAPPKKKRGRPAKNKPVQDQEAVKFEQQLAAMLKQDTTQHLQKSLGSGVKTDLAAFIKKTEEDGGGDRRQFGRDDGRHNLRDSSLNFSDDERDFESN